MWQLYLPKYCLEHMTVLLLALQLFSNMYLASDFLQIYIYANETILFRYI